MSTRNQLLNGADFEGFEGMCDAVANALKNHFPMADPQLNMANPVYGIIAVDTDDDRVYLYIGKSGELWREIRTVIPGGYHRTDTIFWVDCFDHGATADRYNKHWDITALNTQGNGSNVVDTTPSYITLTTDNNAIGDNEGTRTEFTIIDRARLNRSEIEVELGQTANTQFYWGWNTNALNVMNPAADEYVIVFFDVSDDPNWQIKVGNGVAEDVFTSAIPADTDEIIHEIWVEADGTVHWAVNGTEIDITGSVTKKMTANLHYLIVGQAQSVTGAAVIVAEIDYIENEKMK